MSTWHTLVVFTLAVAAASSATSSAASAASGAGQRNPDQAPKVLTLTAIDYAEIQQLSNRYVWAIDACTRGGYDFADLFTDDGEFGLAEQFGAAPTRAVTRGREALANVAGGDGKQGCRDPKTMLGYGISHFVVNHVITPTAAGATGRCYLLAIGMGGDPTKIERQGGYEDVYVKTPAGWRFKSRYHVFPNMNQSVQFGRGGGRGPAAATPASPPATTPPAPAR